MPQRLLSILFALVLLSPCYGLPGQVIGMDVEVFPLSQVVRSEGMSGPVSWTVMAFRGQLQLSGGTTDPGENEVWIVVENEARQNSVRVSTSANEDGSFFLTAMLREDQPLPRVHVRQPSLGTEAVQRPDTSLGAGGFMGQESTSGVPGPPNSGFLGQANSGFLGQANSGGLGQANSGVLGQGAAAIARPDDRASGQASQDVRDTRRGAAGFSSTGAGVTHGQEHDAALHAIWSMLRDLDF